MALMRRGEVWVARLNPDQGAEAGKLRPVIVMQDDVMLASELPTVIVIPLTTQSRPAFEPLRIRIVARDRLLKDAYAMVEQPRALNRSRFGDGPLTALSAKEMTALETSLQAMLGMG